MRRALAVSLSVVLLSGFACSSSDDDCNGAGGAGAANGKGGSGAENGIIFGSGSTSSGPTPAGNSAGVSDSVATEAAPLDIYVMFDQSCSMSCPAEQAGPGLCCIGGPNPRIDLVRKAMSDFLESPNSAGMSIGIGYFGYMQIGQASCNPNDYARADVGIAALPGNAKQR